jgi:DNA repair photolyase
MIKEIQAKTILRKGKRPDSWFAAAYSINIYRGCTHNCIYCDGRYEKYQVEGEFGKDISVKTNAIELLARELNPARKRKPFIGGFRTLSGGVSDAYQSIEKKYELTRQALELMLRFNHPVHILTKSTLVLRDLDLLTQINEKTKALISFSFSTVDDDIARIVEPGVPSPSERLSAIRKLKDAGINVGMYLMPLIPFLTDSPEQIDASVKAAKDDGVDFIVCDGMTLKEGIQKDYFLDAISRNYPNLLDKIRDIYSTNHPYGTPDFSKARPIYGYFDRAATKFQMPKRLPAKIFSSLTTPSHTARIILEQLDYLTRIKGMNSPYGFAANSLAKVERPYEEMSDNEILSLPGVGKFTLKLVREILEKRSCDFYEKLL